MEDIDITGQIVFDDEDPRDTLITFDTTHKLWEISIYTDTTCSYGANKDFSKAIMQAYEFRDEPAND